MNVQSSLAQNLQPQTSISSSYKEPLASCQQRAHIVKQGPLKLSTDLSKQVAATLQFHLLKQKREVCRGSTDREKDRNKSGKRANTPLTQCDV